LHDPEVAIIRQERLNIGEMQVSVAGDEIFKTALRRTVADEIGDIVSSTACLGWILAVGDLVAVLM